MKFTDLASKIVNSKQPFDLREWPSTISPPTSSSGGLFFSQNTFWQNIEKLRKFTDRGSENFSAEYEGSTGWEYELMIALVEGIFYYSSLGTTKDYEHVRSKHSLKIVTELDKKNIIVYDKIMLDGRKVGVIKYKGIKEIENRNRRFEEQEVEIGFVAHFHSHPKIRISNLKKEVFGFFSRQDILSLFQGTTQMVGLVSDRVWIAGKTDSSTIPEHSELQAISVKEASTPERFEQIAGDIMSRHQLALYVAKFGSEFNRIA